MSVSKDLVDIIKESDNKGTKAYDTTATVTRVDGSTVWVHIPGGVDETPVKRTINAKQGDVVQVRVSGGSAWLNGNSSAPPTDDTQADLAVEYSLVASNAADSAVRSAKEASDAAADAKATADSVHGIATQALSDAATAKGAADNASEYAARALGNLSTVQSVTETLNWITQHGTMALTTDVALDPTHVYFVVDAGGDYVVNGVTYAVVTEPDVDDIGTYYELSIDESLNNYVGTHLALTSEGLWLLPASSGTNKVLIATGAGTQYTTAGTYIIDSDGTTVLASFRSDGVYIGPNADGEKRVEIDTNGFQFVSKEEDSLNPGTYYDLLLAGIGYEDAIGDVFAYPHYTLGIRKTNDSGSYGVRPSDYDNTYMYEVGEFCVHDNSIYICIEDLPSAGNWNSTYWAKYIGDMSFAEGNNVVASGQYSHAEGSETNAIGDYSHAEGNATNATGAYSHTEGNDTTATGSCSHAEGYNTDAWGDNSHAEGYNTYAMGDHSHAEGNGSVARVDYSHAEGLNTDASGRFSHVEGWQSVTSGDMSHAQNEFTKTAKRSQTALGSFNLEDTAVTTTHPSGNTNYGNYACIIGNGTNDNSRSNALTVDWNGKVQCGDYSGNFKSIFDIFYPVGSYYETSDTTFDPNVAWGGTWSLETPGKFHVSAGTGYTAGSTGGSADAIVPYHTHTTKSEYVYYGSGSSTGSILLYGTGTATLGYTGSSVTGANMPPYIAVNRWHRTA